MENEEWLIEETEVVVTYFDPVKNEWIERSFWHPETRVFTNDQGTLTVAVKDVARLVLPQGRWARVDWIKTV